jgi:hypothetical protein
MQFEHLPGVTGKPSLQIGSRIVLSLEPRQLLG